MSLHVSIYIDPSNRTAFLEAFKPCFEAVRAEKECLFFEIYSDPDDAGHFSWVENWSRDVEWFMTVCLFFICELCCDLKRGEGWIMDVGDGSTSRCRCWGFVFGSRRGGEGGEGGRG